MKVKYDFLAGGGEMGALMRSMYWAKTGLGPVNSWPQSLRTSVSTCLNSRFPILIWWGPDLIMLYNDAYRPMVGDKHPRSMGQRGRECWPEIWYIIGPMLEGVLERGEATWSENQLLLLERHGFPEECYFTFSYSPIRDENGIGGVFCAVTETTGQVVAERRLRTLRDLATRTATAKSEDEAWQTAVDGLRENPDDVPFAILYRADSDHSVVHLVGVIGEDVNNELAPRTIRISAEDSIWPIGKSNEGMAEPVRGALVLPIGRPGGSPYGYLVAGLSPRRPLDDSYRGFFSLVADHVAKGIANARAYEEEKKRAEGLAQIDRAKTAFFSNVSHEFRTPLTLLLGPVQDGLADREQPLPPVQRERLEMARRSGLRLQKLVNTLLDFSRIEAGRAQASYVPTDLAALTCDLASSFRSAIEKGGLTLTVDCPSLVAPAYVDREMWEKIVLNLLSNAFKFTFDGEIAVTLGQQDDRIELTVRDTGVGIPESEVLRIFERFHRVLGGRSRTHEGTGIGLALVQELVRLHGGSVRVESAEGKGSSFVVSIPTGSEHLPADRIRGRRDFDSTGLGMESFVEEALRWLPDANVQDDARTEGAHAIPADPAGSRARIVWADDNADMRDYVRRLLSQRYDVEAVPNGVAALAAVRARRPDLVLADVMMPVLDGLGLVRALRDDPETRTIPTILLSARVGEESRIEGLDAGADDYLQKPFSGRELLARIDAHVTLARVRREATEAVHRSERELADFFENATIGLHWVGPDGAILRVNQTELDLLGYRREEYVGHHINEFHVDQAAAADILARLVQGEKLIEYPAQLRRKDGAIRHVLISSSGYFEDGTFIHTRCFTVDVTARKRAEEQLLEADRRKDEFLATLSHELRNPLAPLRNAVHVLRTAENGATDATPIHEMMERQVNHLVRLVDDLLEMSRINQGTFELRKERVDVLAITRNALETSNPLIQVSGHQLTVSFPGAPLLVDGDPVRLAQAIANLLSNSAKYTAAGGKISVDVSQEANSAVISVRDNGAGIAPGTLLHIFELFNRGDRRGEPDGLGIGLTLAQRVVEMHGGTISARSDGPGTGSEFTVRVPMAANQRPASTDAPSDTVALPQQRILVVDDNRDAADSLRVLLERDGSDARVARDGPEALQTIRAFNPEVVLLDIGMPGMDGYEVARRIHADFSEHRPTIVALTGWGQPKDRQRARDAGFDHHLVKPVDINVLKALLRSLHRARHVQPNAHGTLTPS